MMNSKSTEVTSGIDFLNTIRSVLFVMIFLSASCSLFIDSPTNKSFIVILVMSLVFDFSLYKLQMKLTDDFKAIVDSNSSPTPKEVSNVG